MLYPSEIIKQYEDFVQSIRESTEAKVKVTYSAHTQRRLLLLNNFNVLPL
jgi:hypothetical protein